MNKYPRHPITKETIARNTLAFSKTIKLVSKYIYEQTDCEKCKVGHFCSRDGDKWGCLSYNNIAEHLNYIGHPTSRGNKWSNKTVRDQITKGVRKLTEQEKQQRIQELDQKRNNEVVWETIEITDGTQEMFDNLENEFGSIFVPVGIDIEVFLVDLKKIITRYHDQGMDVNILHMPREKQD